MNYKNSVRSSSLSILSLFCLIECVGGLPRAHAELGSLGFDSSSFFYRSDDRGTSSTTLKGSLGTEADQKYFHEQGDLTFYTFVNDNPSFNAEAKQAYVSTEKDKLSGVQLTLGRRIYEWSKVDAEWTMMSLWSPRFTWDALYPEQIGMTGFFTSYDNKNFHVLGFISPIAIPERGTPIQEQNGTITSPDPFWKPLPTSQNVQGTPTTVHYSLIMPSMQSVLLRPNGAIKAKYETDMGLWASLGSGILPVNTTPLAAEPYSDLPNKDIQVNVYPQFPMRSLTTAEGGFVAPDKSWNLWVSGSYERPFNFENNPNWLDPVITPATIISSGSNVELTKNFTFHGGVLYIHEEPFTRSGSLPAVSVQLPSRFPLKQGIQVGGDWRFSDYTKSHLDWIQDLQQQNHFVSLDIQHRFPKSTIEVGAGADMIFAQSTEGWVGQFYGDDRIRGWLKYAF